MRLIRYKAIEHERMEDAPFVGALISAIDCHIGCKNCFNQHLKDRPTLLKTADALIAEVRSNPFNEGVILAGLEWSEQPEELVELVKAAMAAKLEIIIYTGLKLDEFLKRVPGLFKLDGSIYIKHGAYIPEQASFDNITHRVKLASSNQRIDLVELKFYAA